MPSFLSVTIHVCHAYSRFCLTFVAYLEIRPFSHSNSSTKRSVRCKKQTNTGSFAQNGTERRKLRRHSPITTSKHKCGHRTR